MSTALQSPKLPPAIACPLTGAYLIEASAGTGKTWTLTGIILRLLIEKGVAPERMIATTFTRAAATEMQERIHDGLVNFLACCQWLQTSPKQALLYQADEQAQEVLLDTLSAELSYLSDPIYRHLICHLLRAGSAALPKTVARLTLLIGSLNKLFIGTLDALVQKWLNEFGDEMGVRADVTVVPEAVALVEALVHDALRREHVRLLHNSPRLYQLVGSAPFSSAQQTAQAIDYALKFFSAPIDALAMPDDETLAGLAGQLAALLLEDWSGLLAYADKPLAAQGFRKGIFEKNFHHLAALLDKLRTHGLAAFELLETGERALLDKLDEKTLSGVILASKKDAQQAWQALPLANLTALWTIYQAISTLVAQYRAALLAKIATEVREGLQVGLEAQSKRTFSLQTRYLLEALSGVKGRLLAEHIRHLYPVALIDESQDMSGEQAALVKRLYLTQTAAKRLYQDSDKGFVLLVGDPKQAIYRFRGGDVVNYNNIKHGGEGYIAPNHDFELSVNFRSHSGLIDALNHWFARFDGTVENANHYAKLGEGIFYHQMAAKRTHSTLDWQAATNAKAIAPTTPITLLKLARGTDTMNVLAQHINALLQSGAAIETDLGKRTIMPHDIAVLARSNRDLQEMQQALSKLAVPALVTKDDSVYETKACRDVYALIAALVDERSERLAALLVALFEMTLACAERLLADDGARMRLMAYLKQSAHRWQQGGVAAGLNYALMQMPLWRDFESCADTLASETRSLSIWQRGAMRADAERYLTDMWQLQTLLGQYNMTPEQLLDVLAQAMAGELQTDALSARIQLVGDSVVALQTIHKSKGLEFPIVYVLGMDAGMTSASSAEQLYPYSDAKYQRRLSATAGRGDSADYFKQQDKQEQAFEAMRLAYVALTRASEQLFIVGQVRARQTDSCLKHWGLSDGKDFMLPEHLLGQVAIVEMEALMADERLELMPYQTAQQAAQVIDHRTAWQQLYRQVRFDGVYRTSFTGLSYHFDYRTVAPAPAPMLLPDLPDYDGVHAAERDDSALLHRIIHANAQALDTGLIHPPQGVDFDIRAALARGVKAGTFLHKVLERLDVFDEQALAVVIDNELKKQGMPLPLSEQQDEAQVKQALCAWLMQVVTAPFMASGVALCTLSKKNKRSEMGFTLGLKDGFSMEDINAAFMAHSDRALMTLRDSQARHYGYLSGEIDLVYQVGTRFFMVDYKSNFLGTHSDDYHPQAMTDAMNRHGYWLQAAIYQLALHRLLTLRLPSYTGDEESYLNHVGAVEYVFLRGIRAQAENVGVDETGRLTWQVPFALVQALDAMLC